VCAGGSQSDSDGQYEIYPKKSCGVIYPGYSEGSRRTSGYLKYRPIAFGRSIDKYTTFFLPFNTTHAHASYKVGGNMIQVISGEGSVVKLKIIDATTLQIENESNTILKKISNNWN